MSIPLSITLVDSNAEITRKIMEELVIQINAKISSKIAPMRDKIRLATFNFLRETDTYDSLVSGDLAGHFGIPASGRTDRIDTIIKAVADRMEIDFKPVKYFAGKFKNGITIGVLMSDLSEVLNLAEGIITTAKGKQLPWLSWLLEAGDQILIREYEVDLQIGTGRSGLGVMDRGKTYVWRVPPEFSGSSSNNWLTRALISNQKAYLRIIEQIIKYELQGI